MAVCVDGDLIGYFDDSFPLRFRACNRTTMMAQNTIADELSRIDAERYWDDIMQHMCMLENETPDPRFIDMQPEIQWFMRPFLIDFLVEAHTFFNLSPDTLFLTTSLLDRYCSKCMVYKQNYQLVGCVALLIASKYGEQKNLVPQISELNDMCCGLYDAGSFAQMEMHVLNVLDWSIGHPTVDTFSQPTADEEHDDLEVKHMASYLSEIALYHRDFVSTKPSTMARSSLALARTVLGCPEAGLAPLNDAEELTMITLAQHLKHPSTTLARKYSSPHKSRVSHRLASFIAEKHSKAVQKNHDHNWQQPHPSKLASTS